MVVILMNGTNYSTDVEYETNDKKKFQITRGMVILAVLALVVLITVIIIIINAIKPSKKEEYTTADFNRLEARMIEEAPTYISQKQIVLTETEIKIDLKDLLLENGGFIDSTKVRAAKICEGYVVAVKNESEKYSSYIKCGNKYTTSGYVSNNGNKEEKTTTTTAKDVVAPTISLVGDAEVLINVGDKFNDPGCSATDNVDGDITSKITKSGEVDVKKTGTYVITYKVSDKAGNKSEVKRTVKVIPVATTTKVNTTVKTTTKNNVPVTTTRKTNKKPTTPPTITLHGSKIVTINVGERYNDPGYSATDSLGANITSKVNVSGNVNTSNPGTYYITYLVEDNYGNRASTSRTVVVKSSVINLSGIKLSPNIIEMRVGESKALTVYYTPVNATNKTISWSSDTPSVATVSNGSIYARSRGTAIITVRSYNGKTDSARVTVK